MLRIQGEGAGMIKEKVIKDYLSRIGRKGGKKSTRILESGAAKSMVKVREAKKAFSKYYIECFWSFDPDLKITKDDVAWVANQLMKYGSMDCWKVGRRLCQ